MTATRQRLFEHDRDERPAVTPGMEIEPLPTDTCLRCGGETNTMTVGQRALFIHGGYGATSVATIRLCTDRNECRWAMLVETIERNPRRW